MAETDKIKTILVIEDETDIKNFATRVLELEGYRILQSDTTEEGIRLIRENKISLVLLDLRLAGQYGWVLLEQLQNEPGLSGIPVVVFTASASIPQREKAFSMGAAGYMVKPLSAAELRKTVSRILHDKE